LALPDGRQGNGRDRLDPADGSWRAPPWAPRGRYARLTATRPTDGVVTIVIVDEPGQDRLDLLGLATSGMAPQLIRRWRRRRWIASGCRPLKPLLATEACQVHSEGASYGPLVLRLMACVRLCYPTCVVCKGHMTRAEMVLSLQHSWRVLDSTAFE
jgi:hypothetical protein